MNGWMDIVNSLAVEESTMYYNNTIAIYENEMKWWLVNYIHVVYANGKQDKNYEINLSLCGQEATVNFS